jgi:hypothetical protein
MAIGSLDGLDKVQPSVSNQSIAQGDDPDVGPSPSGYPLGSQANQELLETLGLGDNSTYVAMEPVSPGESWGSPRKTGGESQVKADGPLVARRDETAQTIVDALNAAGEQQYVLSHDDEHGVVRIMPAGSDEISSQVARVRSDDNRVTILYDQDLAQNLQPVLTAIEVSGDFTMHDPDGGLGGEFSFYPGLPSSTVAPPVEPVRLTDADAMVLIQGEMAIVEPDSPTPLIGTFGIGPCRGILIQDTVTGRAAVAHIDSENEFVASERLLAAFDSPNPLQISITANWDPMAVKVLKEVVGDQAEIDQDLPSDFLLDTRSGKMVPFDPKEAQSSNMDLRMDAIDLRMEKGIVTTSLVG